MDRRAVIDQFDISSHALQFGHMHKALWKDGLGHHARSLHRGEHGAELRLHVGGKAGIRKCLQAQGAARTIW